MRILACSDLHGNAILTKKIVSASRSADLVIAAGDFCNFNRGLNRAMNLLAPVHCPILAVAGNHESVAALRAAAPPNTTVLQGESIAIKGVSFFGIGLGIPDIPEEDWFQGMNEQEAGKILARCSSTDILISHSPPKGIADVSSRGLSLGSTALLAATKRIQPKHLLCGHIHDSWGGKGHIGATPVHNLGPTVNWYTL